MIRHSASTVNRSSQPPGNIKNGTRPGGVTAFVYGICLVTNHDKQRLRKDNGDGLLYGILY
jgi:hypothetical protein